MTEDAITARLNNILITIKGALELNYPNPDATIRYQFPQHPLRDPSVVAEVEEGEYQLLVGAALHAKAHNSPWYYADATVSIIDPAVVQDVQHHNELVVAELVACMRKEVEPYLTEPRVLVALEAAFGQMQTYIQELVRSLVV